MLDFLVRPLRAVLGVAEREMSMPLEDTEREILDAVNAIHRATDSIEHHVDVIEGLWLRDPGGGALGRLGSGLEHVLGGGQSAHGLGTLASCPA